MTSGDTQLTSEKAMRKGHKDRENALGRGYSGDDLGDGGSHEAILPALVS